MAKKRVHLGSKNFFTITVLSVAVLFTLFMSNFFLQQKTSTQSEATGDSNGNLTNCNSKNGRSGGIMIFNGVNQTGGSRVMCVRMQTKQTSSTQPDPNLNTIQSGSRYYDIWNFGNKMDSFILRANRFCHIRAEIYGRPTYQNLLMKTPFVGGTTVDHPSEKPFNLPKDLRDKATSIILYTECALDKYGY